MLRQQSNGSKAEACCQIHSNKAVPSRATSLLSFWSVVCTVVSFSWMQMMMFSVPSEPYELNPVKVRALELFMILHMDHEQNASTSTVRTAGAVLDHATRMMQR